MIQKLSVLFLLALVFSCTSAQIDPVSELNTSLAAENSVSGSAVSRIADGKWYMGTWFEQGANGMRIVHTEYGVWIDASVKNLAYQKKVGIIYTTDNWVTNKVAYASYEGALSNGNEKWGVDLLKLDTRNVQTVQYCLFAEMNGTTAYDNNGGSNYSVQLYY